MMKKGLVAILILLCLGMGAGFVGMYVMSDREGPEITFGSDEFVYEDSMHNSDLLADVKAIDEREGDVTSALTVDTVFVDSDNDSAVIIYVAKDSHNNVTKVWRNVHYNGNNSGTQVVPEEELIDEEQEKDIEDAETSAEPEVTETPEVTEVPEEPVSEEEALAQENENKIAALGEGAPRVYLTQYQVKVAVGDQINRLTYVREITDDADERTELFRKIQISGGYDSSTPGIYAINYFVVDSAGNQSNVATLQVVVE